MLYLSTLIRQTPSNIRSNSKRVRIFKVKTSIDVDSNGEHKLFLATAKTQMKGKTPWFVTIKLYGSRRADGVMKPNNKCWVHCTCPYFQYYVEVALTARGSSNVISSNGTFPKIRNARMRPYLCKHLFAASVLAASTRAKRRGRAGVTEQELDRLVRLLKPFMPR